MSRSILLSVVAGATMLVGLVGGARAQQPMTARTGRRAGMPRRRQRRVHRWLGDQPRLRAARRRLAGRPLCRDHSQGRPRSRHHHQESALAWGVFAPVARLGPGDLAGNYVGAQGSATLGVGVGGNVLVGGSNNTIALQPLERAGPGRHFDCGRSGKPGTTAGVVSSVPPPIPNPGAQKRSVPSPELQRNNFSRLPKSRDRRSIRCADPITGRAPT